MTEHDRAMLLSVRPRFAESILIGAKRAEIRRQRPVADPGTPVIIYATKPIAAVVGTARIEQVCEDSPSELWERYHTQMGLTREELNQYLDGASTGCVLMLGHVQRLRCPLTLDDMREATAFHPPRSYSYLTRSALRSLVNGHPGGGSLLSLLRG